PLLAGLVAVLLAGCAGDTAQDDLESADMPAPPATEQAPMAETPAPSAGMSATAQFQAVGESGVTGEVRIAERGAQTEVVVTLRGAREGSRPGHIHTGTCDAIGAVMQPLEPVTVDASGSGTATSTVNLNAMSVMDGQHI